MAERFDRTHSRFRKDSIVWRIATSQDGGDFDFPQDSILLFDLYDRLHSATDRAVDPLVGRDLEWLGYGADYSLTPASEGERAFARAPGRPSWTRDVRRQGNRLTTWQPLVIDVGAAGKGRLVDMVSELLRDEGRHEHVVDGSGDLRHSGRSSITIGLRHPLDETLVVGTANLRDRALCASSVAGRAWGDGLHHVVDARTGIPTRDVVATWAIAANAMTADGLATALFFADGVHLAKAFEFEFARMFADGRAEASASFPGEMFLTDGPA